MRPEVLPFLVFVTVFFGVIASFLVWRRRHWCVIAASCGLPALALVAYLLYFFRDPDRVPPREEDSIVAAADGTVAAITRLHEDKVLHADCVRISIFLSLFDVHVNRAPISGKSSFLGYFPGKRLFTFQEKSSDVNQHNKILIENARTRCLLCQIVGPVCRRVVYWLDHDRAVGVDKGGRIGMMKFGSRLDLYFPADDVEVLSRLGDTVRAGETVIARVKAP